MRGTSDQLKKWDVRFTWRRGGGETTPAPVKATPSPTIDPPPTASPSKPKEFVDRGPIGHADSGFSGKRLAPKPG